MRHMLPIFFLFEMLRHYDAELLIFFRGRACTLIEVIVATHIWRDPVALPSAGFLIGHV